MKMFFSLLVRSLCALVMIVAVGAGGQADAGNKNNKRKRGTVMLKGAAAELKKVTSVGNGYLTVGDKYYEVRDRAEIIVNGEEASLSQVKKGMQVSVSSRVLSYGRSSEDTIYEATRIVARKDNELAKKAAEHNRKAREQARRRFNNNRNRRR